MVSFVLCCIILKFWRSYPCSLCRLSYCIYYTLRNVLMKPIPSSFVFFFKDSFSSKINWCSPSRSRSTSRSSSTSFGIIVLSVLSISVSSAFVLRFNSVSDFPTAVSMFWPCFQCRSFVLANVAKIVALHDPLQ